MNKKRERKQKFREQSWKLILRQLMNERGPWSQVAHLALWERPQIYWKQDETENKSRMRCKLKVNYKGSDHKAASTSNSSSNSVSVSSSSTSSPSSSSSSLSNRLGISSLSPDDDLFHAAILFSKSQKGVLAPEIDAATNPSALVQEIGGEEDWEMLTQDDQKDPSPLLLSSSFLVSPSTEQTVFETAVALVHPMEIIPGILTLTTTHLYFESKLDDLHYRIMFGVNINNERNKRERRRGKGENRDKLPLNSISLEKLERMRDRKWSLLDIGFIHFRRHQLQKTALELFFDSISTSYFFKFVSEADRNKVHSKLIRQIRPMRNRSPRVATKERAYSRYKVFPFLPYPSSNSYHNFAGGSPMEVLKRSGLTQAWRQRKISNFDYLMNLNTLAGRTYNDLTQYPVFPWILADYESPTIDLHDPTKWSTTYRDLTRPIGALNSDRLKMYVERYNSIDESDMPRFHYGTHYSSAGTVLFYLLRLEPFTTAAISLQDGKFDHPDRLFHSIPHTWRGCLTNPADVKELIPDFFISSDFLRNDNKLDLGKTTQHTYNT